MDEVGQLQCFQQVEASMGSWDSGDKVSWHDLGAELFETAWRWTPVLADGGCRYSDDMCMLAAIGDHWSYWMDLVTVDQDLFQEMYK